MKFRTTLILLILAVAVGGIVVWDYYHGTPTEDALAKGKRLVQLKSDDITEIELVKTNQTILLQRLDDRWLIKKPLDVRGDAGAINSMLDELEFAERERTLTKSDLAGHNLEEFGLASPWLQVKLHTKQGPVSLAVGVETPTKEARYVQVTGRPEVFVVRQSLADRLNRNLDELRDRTVMEVSATAATRLEIRSADRVIELVKSQPPAAPEISWSISRPLVVSADQNKVHQLLQDLHGLKVIDFVSEDPAQLHTYRLDEPAREIIVWSGDVSRILQVGDALTNDTSKVYAKLKGANSIFTMSATSIEKIPQQVNDLRDTRLMVFQDEQVRSVELLRGNTKIQVTRAEPPAEGWRLTTAPGVTVAAEEFEVERLLGDLHDLAIKQFTADVATDLEKYGLVTPSLTVTLQGEATNVIAQALFGSIESEGALQYAKRADQPFIFGIETNQMSQLPASPLALRDRGVAGFKPDQVTHLVVEKNGSRVELNRPPGGAWQLVEPAQGALNVDDLNWVLDSLTELRAEEFVAEGSGDAATQGFDKPELKITATVGDKSYVLQVGNSAEGDLKFASWNDPALVFTLLDSAIQSLRRDLVKAPEPPPPAAPTDAPPAGADAPAAPAPPAQ